MINKKLILVSTLACFFSGCSFFKAEELTPCSIEGETCSNEQIEDLNAAYSAIEQLSNKKLLKVELNYELKNLKKWQSYLPELKNDELHEVRTYQQNRFHSELSGHIHLFMLNPYNLMVDTYKDLPLILQSITHNYETSTGISGAESLRTGLFKNASLDKIAGIQCNDKAPCFESLEITYEFEDDLKVHLTFDDSDEYEAQYIGFDQIDDGTFDYQKAEGYFGVPNK